jgi:bisphosphoglycerate-dependent phosphoglycerate mutase
MAMNVALLSVFLVKQITIAWRLNDRHFGTLQRINKAEAG